ncbi:MAG: TonB-dependent receptor plug domain-containing protein, partial [Gemmatimonadota bacterium]
VGTDLNSIPTAAIERIEILRDGAAAQYGSDAIAGVINIVLKEQTASLEINAGGGGTGEGDGEQVKVDANYGFPIGEGGYFNVTAEYLDRNPTNRSGTFTGPIFFTPPAGTPYAGSTEEQLDNDTIAALGLTRDDFSMRTGMGDAAVGNTFYNAAFPLAGNAEFYSFGGFTHRKGLATGFYRLPRQEERVVFEIFPNGFLPEIHTEIVDAAITGGVRGSHAGWDLDFSLTRGSNSFQYNIENSNNASMGTASPTTFDAGRLSFRQSVGNLDAVRLIDTKGALRSLSLVLGGEFRIENYEIEAGEEASWQLGNGGDEAGVDFDTTSTGAPKDPGSQVFPGFQPSNEVNRYRNSIGAYGGLEMQFTDRLLLDVGGRFENYSDFGRTVTGKIATRYEVAPGLALRGAVSNGFRAPSLHQLWFNNVSIQFLLVGGELVPVRVLTSTNQSRVTKAFGIPDLKEETSLSVSAGFTAQPTENLSITVDGYYITIDDRIVLTSRFASGDSELGAEISDILAPFASQGVGAAQFWANAVDTRTIGADLVATYSRWAGRGFLTLTGSVNLTDTEVERINLAESVSDAFAGADPDVVRSRIFDREERNRLESALPRQKGSISAKYALERFSVLGRVTYFGKIHYRPTNAANDEEFGAKALFDLDVGYQILPGARLSFGGSNILNTFPDPHTVPSNISNNMFIYSRRVTQFGMNGGFYYGRLQLSL